MIKFFQNLWYIIQVKFYKIRTKLRMRNVAIAPHGEYFIKYLIDRYINESIIDDDEKYEQVITTLVEKQSFEQFDKIFDKLSTPEFHRLHTIMVTLSTLLMCCDKEQREKWLDYMEDNFIKQKIKETIGAKK